MNTIIFEAYEDNSSIEWFTSKLFDTTASSFSSVSSISQYPVCYKATSLHILTTNFQSPWNKKEEVETFVLDNKKSHLHQVSANKPLGD